MKVVLWLKKIKRRDAEISCCGLRVKLKIQ